MKQYILIILMALLYSCSGPRPEQEVHRILSEKMVTLATAESCTGGVLSTRFTQQPGASAYFKGGIIAYSHSLKRSLLNIDCATIGSYGVVSKEVVCQMAEEARKVTGADYAIATTGIAGPTGGTPETPVGTVWIAVATPNHTVSKLFFGGDTRSEVIDQASTATIELLLEQLLQE